MSDSASGNDEHKERRRSFRVRMPATAVLRRPRSHELIGWYKLENLSSGGCLVTDGPGCEPGEQLEVLLELPDTPEIRLRSAVVRREGSGRFARVALSFASPSMAVEESIHNLVLRNLESQRERGGCVLVLHPHQGTRDLLVGSLATLGFEAVAVGSPLEAIWNLEEQPGRFHTAIVSRFIIDVDGHEMVKWMAARHPDLRRVLICSQSALLPAGSEQHIHDVLRMPWDIKGLRKVLPGLPEPEPETVDVTNDEDHAEQPDQPERQAV